MSKKKTKKVKTKKSVEVDVVWLAHLYKVLDNTYETENVYEILEDVRGCLMDLLDQLHGGGLIK